MSKGNFTIEALNRENYDTWRMQMEAILIKNDCLGYVLGKIEQPSDEKGVLAWKEADAKAKADIILCISPSELKQVRQKKELSQKIARTAVKGTVDQYNHMQSLCKNHFLQQLYRKIDGAVLKSRNERNLDCIITFQTHSILQRFMLRFDELTLDCNDHLYIYDGAHAVGTHKADLSCRNTKQAVGAIFTRTNFVTLKYVTDGWGTDQNGFDLVITAVKDPKHACTDFRCIHGSFCIAKDLVCDGVSHCADGSDELLSSDCARGGEMGTIFGVSMTMFVVGVVSSALILCAFLVGLSICVCRRPPLQRNTTTLPPDCVIGPTEGAPNGAGRSENWAHPAGRGYTVNLRATLYTLLN